MSGRTFPWPRVRFDAPDLWRLGHDEAVPRRSQPARDPLPALRIRSPFRVRIVRLGRGRLRRHLIVERCGSCVPPVKKRYPSRCSTDAFSRVDLAARARGASFVCTMLCARIRFRSHRAASLSGLGPILGPSFGSAADRVPCDPTGALSARRHPCEDPGELGRPPLGSFSRGAPSTSAGTSGHAWVRPGGDPGLFDRCQLLTDVVFKDDRPKSR